MENIQRKKLMQFGPYGFMRHINRIEALQSFGISAEKIESIDKKMKEISAEYKAKNQMQYVNSHH